MTEIISQTNGSNAEHGETSSSIPPPIEGMTNTPFIADRNEEVATTTPLEDQDHESIENHKSVIMHIISQLKDGKDMTKISLPTFILERRSLLEMFADYNAHPQMLIDVTNGATPHERMKSFVIWFLTVFHASRKDKVAKKPYNPIIGEVFQCSWRLPKSSSQNETSNEHVVENGGSTNEGEPILLTFIGEQVSHHPPVSAFRICCPSRRLELVGAVHTASHFRGLSIFVNFVGKVVLKLGEHNEEYVFTLPNAYGRSILTVPWFELGDTIAIKCPQSGYRVQVKFYTKTVTNNNRLHQISADIFAPETPQNSKEAVVNVSGHWNSTMEIVDHTSGIKVVIDTTKLEVEPKWVRPVTLQKPEESQRLWFNITEALKQGNIELATQEKAKLEEVQRVSENSRMSRKLPHIPRFFKETPNGYIFVNPTEKENETPK
nr:hypothetical protein HmN_000027400 [Hymenolepis microstoma]